MSLIHINRRKFLRAGATVGVGLAAPMHFVRGAWAQDTSCNVPTGDTVTYGLNLPLSGPYADEGADELKAYQLAVKHLNGEGDGGLLKTMKPTSTGWLRPPAEASTVQAWPPNRLSRS